MKLLNKITVSIFLVSYLFLSGCSSNNTAGGQVNPNTVGTPFTVKYELLTTSQFVAENKQIVYTNSTGQTEYLYTDLGGLNSWSKTINVTATNRPFSVAFVTDNLTDITTPGTVTLNIYINGVIKASSTYQGIPNTSPGSTYYYVVVAPVSYTVN